jgi:catechol 2,3-dioxygenase-like lactoylglutathione lyase family enzyme
MFSAFDHILIKVPDMNVAVSAYANLLGQAGQDGRFELANVSLRLTEDTGLAAPKIAGLALLDEDAATGSTSALDSGAVDAALFSANTRTAGYRDDLKSDTGIYAVDHLVLQTQNADACIALFRDRLSLRLALDQEVPEWGGRMLFFRHGKMTLEVIQNLKEPPASDFFWGITYLCRDLEFTTAKLEALGIELSPIRDGRKPGTRVSTVKSHCLGLPTLLLEQ